LGKIRILIIDNIGMLARVYRYADAAIVGGAFGKGLHNILEAAAFGMPVLFGPKHDKHPEGAESMDSGFGFECSDFDSFERNLKNAIGNAEFRAEAAEKARNYVKQNSGATATVLGYLVELRKEGQE
jgi:3-deoxy-D-manno-octulosonic-acid transferase